MATYTGQLDITELTAHGGIGGPLSNMRNARDLQHRNDRDIEPLNAINARPIFGRAIIEKLLSIAMTDLGKNPAIVNMEVGKGGKNVDEDFQDSIDYWQTNKYAEYLGKENKKDYEDSAIGSKKYEFHTMTALGKNRNNPNQVIMKAMSSIPNGAMAMMQYLLLFNQDDKVIAGQYSLSVPKPAFEEIELTFDLSTSATGINATGINGVYIVHYFNEDNSGNYTNAYIGIQYWQEETYPVSDPVIEAPVQEPHNDAYHNIVIGLGRGTTIKVVHSDADYRYSNKPAGQALIPFKGSVDFGSNIEDITTPGNLKAKFFLTTPNGSVRKLINEEWTKHITRNGTTLKWDWNYIGNYGKGLADFGPINWGVDHAAYLHFEVGVKTAQSNGEFVYAQIHSVDKNTVPKNLGITSTTYGQLTQDNVVDGVAYICPVEHSWHCVASGTLVIMDNGSTKPIDNIRGGEVLRIDAENTMEVRSTVEQPVMDTDTVYELIDSKGNTLIITGDHWIAQPNGYKPVAELAQSDEILTVSGTATIKSLKQVDFNGKLLTLSLGNHEQRPTIGFEGTTFVANNILVGDNQLCRVQNLLRLKDHEHLTAKLPSGWKAVADALQALAS